MPTPLILITISYISGIFMGRGFLYFPYASAAFAIIALLISALVTKRNGAGVRSLILSALPVLIGMASYVYSAAYLPAGHYARIISFDNKKHEITGKIISPLDRDADRFAFILSAHDMDGTPATGRMRVSVRDADADVGYGDIVRLSGRVYGPRKFHNPGGFDYPAYLARSGIHAAVSVRNADDLRIVKRGRGAFRAIQDMRERIRQKFLASTSGPGSAVLQAMVLGEEGGLTDGIRDVFMAAGVTHILSISGSHLGMVAIVCFFLIRGALFLLPERLYHRLTLAADPRKIAVLVTLPPLVFYALLAGGQVATMRSLVMITAALAALVLDRENALMRSLAAAALLILAVNPQSLFDISFQLSFISVLSIGFAVSVWKGMRIRSEGFSERLRNWALLTVSITLSASMATGPLVARYFNQFSLIGVVSNMLVVPFAGIVVVPLGLVSGVLSLFLQHLPFASFNQTAADVFWGIVLFFSRIPLAEFHPRSPGAVWLVAYGVFAISISICVRGRLLYAVRPLEHTSRSSRALTGVIIASFSALAIATSASLVSSPEPRVTFLDVGQGDCALMRLPSGETVLMDGGGSRDDRFDVGRRVVAPYLWDNGVRTIDLVILSHPHPDHMNGLKFIVEKFRIKEIWDHGQDADIPAYRDFRLKILEKNIRHRTMSAGRSAHALGSARFYILHPPNKNPDRRGKAYIQENNRSIVLRMEAGGRSFMFPGDIGREAEASLLRNAGDLSCDIIKVPHHGSSGSSSEDFVKAARPRMAVVSVGKGNPYRHPSDEVVYRYERTGAKVYRTDLDGAVIATWGEGGITAVRWADLEFRMIGIADPGQWAKREMENWGRLLKRLNYDMGDFIG